MKLLTEPVQQSRDGTTVSIVWFREGKSLDDAIFSEKKRLHIKVNSAQLNLLAEDRYSNHELSSEHILFRDIYRCEADLGVLEQPLEIVCGSKDSSGWQFSESVVLHPRPKVNEGLKVLLTSDYQLGPNAAAAVECLGQTVGQELRAIFFAGDIVNCVNRASEWFDTAKGNAFFATMQGRAKYRDSSNYVWKGAKLLQQAPIYPCIGNHEVSGRAIGYDLDSCCYSCVPREIAEKYYLPDSGLNKEEWLAQNSFNTDTYLKLFDLPDGPQQSRYYAVSVGNIFLISLFVTRPWRLGQADPNYEKRFMDRAGRFQERIQVLGEPLKQGYGSFPFEAISADSAQIVWLKKQLKSSKRASAKYTVVMMHEGPHGIGEHVDPPFCQPERTEEYNSQGELVGIRYDYSAGDDRLMVLVPILEEAGVDLVFSGHSHLWNRFISPSGTHYLESSNVGNSYGAFHYSSKQCRTVPPKPWKIGNVCLQGDPGKLEPQFPTELTLRGRDGVAHPFLASNRRSAFSVLDSTTGEVTSWLIDHNDKNIPTRVFDRFQLGQ